MASNFPSINDLIKKPADAGTPAAPGSKSAAAIAPAKVAKKFAPADLDSAAAKFEHKMEEMGLKEVEHQTEAKATSLGMPYLDLSSFPVSTEALKLVPEEQAKALQTVCFFYNANEEVRLGTVDLTPEVQAFIKEFEDKYHIRLGTYLISQHSFEHVIKLYANLPIVKAISKDIVITDEDLSRFSVGVDNLQTLQDKFKDVSITDIITLIVASALKVNSSDMHIEAEEKGVAVRYRIDGVLHDVATLPSEEWKRFVSRIKLLAALKINVADRPQDGRVTLSLSSGSIDVRVSTIPTTYGESVVMRILHSGSKGVTFDDLGLTGSAYEKLKHEITRPNGMIITTGPTGSGKTTTLYAVLRTLNKPGVKIITLEDPVEIKMEGINQSQVDSTGGYTFAKGLKSILRQDPDICMVGEIRDLETAEVAIQMALTGHLMLSTIHTNSAAGAIPRFLSMGVKPFLLAPALNCVIGQRLVRRICDKCIEETTLAPEIMDKVNKELNALPETDKKTIDLNNLHFYKGKGCSVCSGLGYKGRVGIYEIFVLSKETEQVILSEQVSEYTIQEIAVKQGMVTMVQDGILKALNKITAVEEVYRVTE